ncbi:lysylphosphatidylglycerol synthase domain-containing protein [Mycoplasmoides fastidiosum]|uniref:lysylphosphatidylglycerol synthase domain-containing protein n=1 Tax=Mycoplasmoides fastidiosum TaxID=92758 RepID=UPI002114A70A|nr:lysylphosphatidylglycerol synthase domain-containing protein [Mycoplasmoides fastidiosum]UUD37753.1 flippase-like domain-containing protein [Mycoplasmoides fastidiosum]
MLDIDFHNLLQTISNLDDTNRFLILAIVLSIINFFIVFLVRILNYSIKLRKVVHEKISYFDWIKHSFVGVFMQMITPFSIGSEPYFVWWLSRKGVSRQKIGTIIGTNLLAWSAMQTIITWPSFIAYSVDNSAAIVSGQVTYIYYIVMFGLLIDITMLALIFGINYSRRIHVAISSTIHFFRKILKMKYITREEIVEKYKNNASYKIAFRKEILEWDTLILVFNNFVATMLLYVIFVLFYYGFNPFSGALIPWNTMFNIINIGTTANNFVPIPNVEGTLQFTLNGLVSFSEIINNADLNNQIANSIFAWRFFTNYLIFAVSLIFIVFLGSYFFTKKTIKYRRKKLNRSF